MNAHIDDLLPYYINHTLDAGASTAVETHLASCPSCRALLVDWEKLSSAVTLFASSRLPNALTHERPSQPPLSPLVFAGLKRRPPLHLAIRSATTLIWVQRVALGRNWLMPSLGCVIIFGILAAFVFQVLASEWVVIPLFAVVPIAAALSTAFLYTFEDDPACEIISAAPTALGTLIFARLTLALAAISLLAFLGSLPLAVFGQTSHSLFDLVATWLGPMLLLSALTTALSLWLHTKAAAGAALIMWGSILLLLFGERAGAPLLKISLLWLLHPSWMLLAAQVLLAGLIWLASWLWLAGSAPSILPHEGSR